DAGIEVADDEFHAVAHELVGDRYAFLRIGAVVADEDLDLLPEDAAGGVDVLHRLLGTVLELRAEGGAAAGERTPDAELDLRRSAICQCKAEAEGQAEREPLSHGVYPWIGNCERHVSAWCRDSSGKPGHCHSDFVAPAAVEWSRRRQRSRPVRWLIHL